MIRGKTSIMDKGILSKIMKGVRLGFSGLNRGLCPLRPSFLLQLPSDFSVIRLFVPIVSWTPPLSSQKFRKIREVTNTLEQLDTCGWYGWGGGPKIFSIFLKTLFPNHSQNFAWLHESVSFESEPCSTCPSITGLRVIPAPPSLDPTHPTPTLEQLLPWVFWGSQLNIQYQAADQGL